VTATLIIPAEEHRTVRVFAINLPEAEVAAMLRDAPTLDTALTTGDLPQVPAAADLLGHPDLDTRHTELFGIRDLTGLGLTGYLTEGLGLEDAEIAPDRARLSALDGYVLIVLSRAFGGQAATLEIPPTLTLIGTYREKTAPVLFEPLPGLASLGELTGLDIPEDKAAKARLLRLAALSALLLMLLAIALVAIIGGTE
jgi:hypothetical protein